jgi:hypothetical protein
MGQNQAARWLVEPRPVPHDPGTSFPTKDAMGFQDYTLIGKPDEGKGVIQSVFAATWHPTVAQGGKITPRSCLIRSKTSVGAFF